MQKLVFGPSMTLSKRERTLYPCHCTDLGLLSAPEDQVHRQEESKFMEQDYQSCECKPGRKFFSISNKTKKDRTANGVQPKSLQERLQIAAEFWSKESNFEKHWSARWGSTRVLQLLQQITGKVPETSVVHGKQLLRLAIQSILNSNQEKSRRGEDFAAVIPLAVHRKKVARVMMQVKPPSFDFVNKETPRDGTFFQDRYLAQKNPTAYLDGANEALEFADFGCDDAETALTKLEQRRTQVEQFVQHVAPYPVLVASGPSLLYPGKTATLSLQMATPEFLLVGNAGFPWRKSEGGDSPPKRLDEKSSLLRPGIELTVIPRIKSDEIQLNPERQSFKWMKECHRLDFDIEWVVSRASQGLEESYSRPEGVLEVWSGPILIGTVELSLLFGDEQDKQKSNDTDAAQGSWMKLNQLFKTVQVAYPKQDKNLKYAIGRSESDLQGCVTVLHIHQQGNDHSVFLSTASSASSQSIQLCLSQSALQCSAFLSCSEKVLKAIALQERSGRKVPAITLMFWSHPKPDLASHPVLSRIAASAKHSVFWSGWLMNLPIGFSETGLFSAQDLEEVFKKLQPGTEVVFRNHLSKWERGRIVSQDATDPSYMNVLSDSSGELVRSVHHQHIKLLGSNAPAADELEIDPNNHAHDGTSRQFSSQVLSRLRVGGFCYARTPTRTEYLPGVVVMVHHATRTVDVAFDNGDAEAHLDVKHIRFPIKSSAPTTRYAGKSPRNARRPRTAESSGQDNAFRSEETGLFSHGKLVQVIVARTGQHALGRVSKVHEYGLKYDVLLTNGELLLGVPRYLISPLEASGDTSTVQKGHPKNRTYVEAMFDRLRQMLNRAALSENSAKHLRIQFDSFDLDRDGLLSTQEFMTALQGLGFSPSDTEVYELIDLIAPKTKGVIEYRDFVRFALPFGVLQKERQLRKSISFYETSLAPIGILNEIQRVVGNSLGVVWQAFTERDTANVGTLSESEFIQCLLHINIGLTSRQRQSLVECFGGADGLLDYREFASVVELLLAQRFHDSTITVMSKTEDDASSDGQENKLSAKGKRLALEIRAVTKIQAMVRMRLEKKRAMALRGTVSRTRNNLEAMLMQDQARASSFWRIEENSREASILVDDFDSLLKSKTVNIDRWRKLVRLNTRDSLEIGPLFRSFDTDCDGVLSLQEVSKAIQRHGIHKHFATLLFREMDHNQDGVVDLTDFKLFVRGVQQGSGIGTGSGGPAKVVGIQGLIDEFGKDLCMKLRRFYGVLTRCGSNLLDALLFRPRCTTVCNILKKQGFVLSNSEWRRLEVYFATSAEHRGDRVVCEEFVEMLSMKEKELEKHESLREEKHVREYLAAKKTSLPSQHAGELGRLCFKILQGIRTLCKDRARRKDKHRALWWVLSVSDQSSKLMMDRLDLELFLEEARVDATSGELDKLFEVLPTDTNGRVACSELTKFLNIQHKLREYLESDYLHSRFDKHAVYTQRLKVDQKQHEMTEALCEARKKGREHFAGWVQGNIGVQAYKRLRANLIASEARQVLLCDGSWLCERQGGKLGVVSERDFLTSLYELGVFMNGHEASNFVRLISVSGQVDLFLAADLCAVVARIPTRLIVANKTKEKEDEDNQVLGKIRVALQKYTRTSEGHRNLVKMFQSFDTGGNGTVDHSELELVFQYLRVDLKKGDISLLLRRFDRNRDGQLDYLEFLQALGVKSFGAIKKQKSTTIQGSLASSLGTGIEVSESLRKKLGQMVRTNRLVKEDIDDACGKAPTQGLLSRREIHLVLADLGFSSTLSDEEVSSLVRLTQRQFRSALMHVLELEQQSTPAVSSPSKGARGGRRAASNPEHQQTLGSIHLGTKVVFLSSDDTRSSGRVVRAHGGGKYDVSLDNGRVMKSVARTQLRVVQGRPPVVENAQVVEKATLKVCTIVRVTASDASKIDVSESGKVYRNLPVSKFVMYHGQKEHYKAGAPVECLLYGDMLYYSGRITRDFGDGTYAITLDHGEQLSRVPLSSLRPLTC